MSIRRVCSKWRRSIVSHRMIYARGRMGGSGKSRLPNGKKGDKGGRRNHTQLSVEEVGKKEKHVKDGTVRQ